MTSTVSTRTDVGCGHPTDATPSPSGASPVGSTSDSVQLSEVRSWLFDVFKCRNAYVALKKTADTLEFRKKVMQYTLDSKL